MALEMSFKIPKDVIDVMAQLKTNGRQYSS
jgi:hypothetical protein